LQVEAAQEALEFVDGEFGTKGVTGRWMQLADVVFEAFKADNLPELVEPSLEASVAYDPPNFTFPFGTHVAVVEVDEETGRVHLMRYAAVDDCGNQINPL